LLQWNDPKHTRNHRFRLIGNQDLSMFFNALQVYGRKLVGRFLGSNRMLAGTEVVKCPCEMRAWSLSTKVLL
jgi:hypothetical protein